MRKTIAMNNLWVVEKRPAVAYNDFDEYVIRDKTGRVISKIPNHEDIARKIVELHNEALFSLICEDTDE